MFFAESMGRTDYVITYRYNLQPFKEIMRFLNNWDMVGTLAVLLNIGGNVLAFAPLGFCLPMLSDHRIRFIRVTLLSAGLSLLIELIQLCSRVGSFDVDDIILNTMGGIVGYIVFCICMGIINGLRKNKKG